MTEYYGKVQSIIRRGRDAYQVTLGIYPLKIDENARIAGVAVTSDKLLTYRADITIEDDRTILFPDRELDKCMEAFYDSNHVGQPAEGFEAEWIVGSIADRICREIREYLLERATIELA